MSIVNKYIRNAEDKFVCPHCGVIKAKQNTMLYHILSTHEKTARFTCNRCEDSPPFLQRCSYLHHLATIHPDNPHISEKEKNPYAGVKHKCPDCDHSTHTKANALIHYVRTHCKTWIPAYTKDAPCTGCKKVFSSGTAYLYHAASCLVHNAPSAQASIISRIK